MNTDNRIQRVLFMLRVTVFFVMLMWTIDKFLNPQHAAAVYEKFYYISGMDLNYMMIIGIVELVILVGFLLGFMKTYTYGLVFLFHTVSTVASYQQYITPFEGPNLLFFAAWPMIAACYGLFLLRDMDTIATLGK